jgi:uncharacterized protein
VRRRPGDRKFERQLTEGLPKLAAGDAGAAALLLREDAVLRVPGRSRIVGEYRGRGAIVGLFETLADLSDDTFGLEVLGVSLRRWSGEAHVRVTAKREGRVLEEEQRIRFELVRGRIQDASFVLEDRRTYDAFWGPGRRPLLTREDQQALAKALSQGDDGDRRSGSVLLVLLLAFVAAWLLILGLQSLQDWRRPVALALSAERATDTKVLQLSGSVEWTLEGANLRALIVEAPQQGAVDLVLPVTVQEACGALEQLGHEGPCASGQVLLETDLDVEWSKLVLLTTEEVYKGRQLEVRLTIEDESASVSILTWGESAPTYCFSGVAGSTLTLRQGGVTAPPITLTDADADLGCSDGFHLLAGDEGRSQPPKVKFGGVTDLQLTAGGQSATLQGLNGRVRLDPGGSHVVSTQGQVVLAASARRPLSATLKVPNGSLQMLSSGAKSALTDDGELVPSVWDRYTAIIGPLFAALVGVLVLAPLMAVIRRVTDYFTRLDLRRVWRRLVGSIGGS